MYCCCLSAAFFTHKRYNYVFGQVAQLVEQRIENPRVGGSIPPLATTSQIVRRTALV